MKSKFTFFAILFLFFFTPQFVPESTAKASILPGEFPVINNQDTALQNEILVVLQDVLGEEVYSKVVLTGNNESFLFATDPKKNIAPGTYMVVASADHDLYFRKMVIR